MIRVRFLLIVAIITIAITGASTQSRTADGVAALVRGDYQQAVEILKPIAEDWRSRDAAAQFFMATLYEAGHGVSADPLRACALYARAGSNSDDPFGRQATTLLAASRARGKEFSQHCDQLAHFGFDTGFEPMIFDLGPGHFVDWTLDEATVTYDGRTKTSAIVLGDSGARFLPLQHTELGTGSTRSLTRHFVEAFVWCPNLKSGQWTGQWNLEWSVFEIVRDEMVQIDVPDSLIAVDGDAPPSRETFDVREYAALRVDDEGNAEWAVLKGPHTATQRIQTDDERREDRETATARDAALKRVDWKQRSDVQRQPSMTYVGSGGCGFATVYGWTANRDETILVHVTADQLTSAAQSMVWDISRSPGLLTVSTSVYDGPQREFPVCTDVSVKEEGAVEPEVWQAISGTVSIEFSAPGIRANNPYLRRAVVTLSNLVLRNSVGATVTMSGPLELSAIIGTTLG